MESARIDFQLGDMPAATYGSFLAEGREISRMDGVKERIPTADFSFHPASFADTHGRLLSWKGEVLRGVSPEWTEFYKSFLKEPCFHSLVSEGLLIETEPTYLEAEGYSFIVKHRRIDVVSYPYEWCFSALKDAALLILSLQQRLQSHGLTLQDCHPWNVMFDGCRPVYVDFGSIMPDRGTEDWPALGEFREFLLNPLIAMAGGHSKIVRALFYRIDSLSDEEARILAGPTALSETPTLTSRLRRLLPRVVKKTRNRKISGAPSEVLSKLRERIAALSLPEQATEWSHYYETFPARNSDHFENPKQDQVLRVLQNLRPSSVLDIASNRGWYAQLATRFADKVIAFDLDEKAVDMMFNDCKAGGLSIYPFVMNIINPSPALGVGGRTFPPASERFKAEMVFALALVHHLVFKKMRHFEQIVEALENYCSRWLLVEFVPKEDRFVSEWWTERYDWYHLDNFEAELRKHFRKVELLESAPAPRVLLLCEI